ncbi:class I tRNA ligase family protein, partial [Candidatus Micrarchaeota archaeon]|nr:class I tRNA ligase family protein [Candidatus Micrarchaeota archaeon]
MKLYNSLNRKIEEFEPAEDKKVVMYVCGLTPYDDAHIGHARTFVAFDIIKRYLLYGGYEVKHIQNITDVEDKIIKRARELNVNPVELAEKYQKKTDELMEKLNVLKADAYPKVSEHIPEIIEMIKKIIENGYAYETEKGVYFEISKFKDYGK